MFFKQQLMTFMLVSLMLLLVAALPTDAQELVWEQTNGPYGRYIKKLFAMPDGTLYASLWTGGGVLDGDVFRSVDGGEQWTRTELRGLNSLVVIGTTLYAGGDFGVFRSVDGA